MSQPGANEYWTKFLGGPDEDVAFDHLLGSMRDSIKAWDWYVNWKKVYSHRSSLEMALNTLNYVVGKPDVKAALREVLREHPGTLQLFPILIATRDKELTIVETVDDRLRERKFRFDDVDRLSEAEVEEACEFASRSGLLDLFRNVRNLPDYVLGVEVGLDSNSRKNRTGSAMEQLVQEIVLSLRDHGAQTLTQATPGRIRESFGKVVPPWEGKRKFDFAAHFSGVLTVIEANYYSTRGSKLNSVGGQYSDMADRFAEAGHRFVWVTDGCGWHKTRAALRDAFRRIGFVMNLEGLQQGALGWVTLRSAP